MQQLYIKLADEAPAVSDIHLWDVNMATQDAASKATKVQ